jgi:hypothetical protein
MQHLELPYQRPRRRSCSNLLPPPTDQFGMHPEANMPQEPLYSGKRRPSPRRSWRPGRDGPCGPPPGPYEYYSDEETEDECLDQQGRRRPDDPCGGPRGRRQWNDGSGDRRGPREGEFGVQVWWNLSRGRKSQGCLWLTPVHVHPYVLQALMLPEPEPELKKKPLCSYRD